MVVCACVCVFFLGFEANKDALVYWYVVAVWHAAAPAAMPLPPLLLLLLLLLLPLYLTMKSAALVSATAHKIRVSAQQQ